MTFIQVTFILLPRQFISRTSYPKQIRSDNGITFVGTERDRQKVRVEERFEKINEDKIESILKESNIGKNNKEKLKRNNVGWKC